MQIITYKCDKCGRELKDRYQMEVFAYGGHYVDLPDLAKKDFCPECIRKIVAFADSTEEPEREEPKKPVEESVSESGKREEKPQTITIQIPHEEPVRIDMAKLDKTTPPKQENRESSGKEKCEYHRLSEEQKEEAVRRYKDGQEMEDISKEMPCDFVALSRYIDKMGLGKERYKGQKITHTGSAQIPTAVSVRGTV